MQINVLHQGKTQFLHSGKVHPVREEAETIVSEGSCLMLTTDLVETCISGKGISEESRLAGFDAQLTITYVVLTKSGKPGKSGRAKRG